jgi:hypothetical protein
MQVLPEPAGQRGGDMPTFSRPILSVLTALSVFPLAAQNFGEITGTVTDASGAVITAVSVTVTNTATNQVRQMSTNQTGNYSVPYLVPGVYDVRAETPGFKASTRKSVELQVGAVARIDFTMEIGEATQQVEVSGGAPLLATENAAVGTVIENRRIVDLPLNGRNYLQLVTLSPNVTTEGGAGGASGLQGGARASTSLSVAGQRLEFNRYTLDGVENTDPNFNSYIIQPSVDFIQEFKVQTGVYSAEFGRATSQISATTKAGGNQYHGTAFEFLRNSALDAKQWNTTVPKNPFRRNQYGFTLGGPIEIPKVFNGKDKLFFQSNLEELRDRTTSQIFASVATDRMRAGDFSLAGRSIFDPLSRTYNASGLAIAATQFPNNVIPASRLNRVSQQLFEFYQPPTVPGDTLLNNFSRNGQSPLDQTQFNQRVDWTQSSKSTWFGRYSWGDEVQTIAATFPSDNSITPTKVSQEVLSNTRIFGAGTVNEFRFGHNQFFNDVAHSFSFNRNVAAELKIPGLNAISPAAYGVPSVGLAQGVTGFGGADAWSTRNHTFQFLDNVSVVRGRHSIKFGGEVRRDRYNQLGNQKSTGEFNFDGTATFNPAARTTTGFAFADYMLGEIANSARAVAVANTMLRSTSFYGYIQDDWKITPRLTLSAGLRYENVRPWTDKYRGIMNAQIFDPGVGPNGLLANTKLPVFVRPGSGDFYQGVNFHFADGMITAAGNQYLGQSLVYPDNNNFAPRLGIAYSPTQKWTVRAGVGVFYTQDTANPVFDMGRNLGGRDSFVTDLERRNQNFSDPWAFERQSFTCTGYSGTCIGTPQFLGNIPTNRTPYVYQWVFNIQRQLTENLVVEAGYQGNEGHKLQRLRLYNQPILKSGPTDARSIADRSPWPVYGRLQEVDGGDNSNYHAMSLKVTQRFSKGLTYLVGYTWSKAIDDGSAIRTNTGDQLWPTNNYDFSSMHGLAQFQVGRRLVASYVYELPFGAGKALANRPGVIDKIVGGWQFGGILTFADGSPTMSVGTIGDSAALNNNSGPNRANATGISPIPSGGQTAQQFWNIASLDPFSPTLTYLIGNLGRDVFFKPGTRQADLSMTKNIRVHEEHSLQFRFDAFNATNHPNWNVPAGDARAPATFGIITTAKTMRQLQFALKYAF